jgi:hypothetical protein
VLLGRDPSIAQTMRGNEAGGIIVPERVTKADDDHSAQFSRSTSSFRKWVAQEMHGS